VNERGRGCEARGARGGGGDRIVDLARGCVCRHRDRAQRTFLRLAACERADRCDRFAGTTIPARPGLEQMQHARSAVGGPEPDDPAVVVGDRRRWHR
jgi:hypothetical protein